MTSQDPIVKEVREAREEYAAQFDYDLRAISEDLKAQEVANGRKTVYFPPKRRRPVEPDATPGASAHAPGQDED